LDPPDAIQHLRNRQYMLQAVADMNLSDSYGIFFFFLHLDYELWLDGITIQLCRMFNHVELLIANEFSHFIMQASWVFLGN